jgi:3-methylcrotonyl-CoA carboxylase alpha subunit/acetyl-CoA/propionyl-CoA carboxylase biotin carboxyl carrier protein
VSPFGTLLIANRGEIALRVIRAAREAGLQTVAVYSDADARAPHVLVADAAVHIGPARASDSYLSIPRLLEAARRAGADAVHPGYGFLSENAGFARACQEAGLIFVGPAPEVIERLGSKNEARRVAVAADVPVVPGFAVGREDHVLERAREEIGFPLMVKAAAGGGGKGMRVVRSADGLAAALEAAAREAKAAFADDSLLLERLLERARHVEVQVLGDEHGTVLHLFERDCSVQRRHQKVIEEARAPTIDDGMRGRLGDAAVRLAREVGYTNAGTVEFLVAGEDFYFLEMNTRLQVEHPVTEEITGLDLVALQLRVAAGEPLPFAQEDVRAAGHAIEVRVYAEDPAAGFLPAAGTPTRVRWSSHARVESALEAGVPVGTTYDPMLAKVIARGPSREAARRALLSALDGSAIFGLTSNLGFLRALVASEEFARAKVDTGWLDRNPGAYTAVEALPAAYGAAWARAAAAPADSGNPFASVDAWRLGGPPAAVRVEFERGSERIVLAVDRAAGTVSDGEREVTVRALHEDAERLLLEIDGVRQEFHVELRPDAVHVVHEGSLLEFREPLGRADRSQAISDGGLLAPMPGSVLRVSACAGEAVTQGQVLLILEAMKMELALTAPFDGTVEEITVGEGDQVTARQLLARVTEDHADG